MRDLPIAAYGTTQSDAELVATVSGLPFDAAALMLERVGGLAQLDANALVAAGIVPARRVRILAALELGARRIQDRAQLPKAASPRDLAAYLLPRFTTLTVEHVGVVSFNTRLRILGVDVVAIGSADTCQMHPRDIFRAALARHAAQIALFHNHPSGDVTPSADDVRLTARLAQAGVTVGIDVLDHLILGGGTFYSFRESGGLPASKEGA